MVNSIMARCITVFDTTLRNKVCQCLAVGLWFSPVSSTIKTDCHDIIEILLKLVINTIKQTNFIVFGLTQVGLERWPLLE
jgi:hypothetical protein